MDVAALRNYVRCVTASHIYDSDQPIHGLAQDTLGREGFVRRLANPLVKWPPDASLVVGLYGDWGTGKSSVLNCLDEVFDEISHSKDGPIVRVVRFNPWYYHSSDALLASFFSSLLDAVTKIPRITAGAVKAFEKLTGLLAKTVGPMVATYSTAHGAPLDPEQIAMAADAAETLAALAGREPTLYEQKEKVGKILAKLGSRRKPVRIVVLVDELDRAERSEVQAMLKAVKLIGDLPSISYVLAMDLPRVSRILDQDEGDGNGVEYLSKIVQVPVYLPTIDDGVFATSLKRAVAEIFEAAGHKRSDVEDGDGLDSYFDTIISKRVLTLRDKARLCNSLRFFLLSDSPSDVHPMDALLVSFLLTFYPNIYASVSKSGAFLTTSGGPDFLQELVDENAGEEKTIRRAEDMVRVMVGHAESIGGVDFLDEFMEKRGLVVPYKAVLALFPHALEGINDSLGTRPEWRRENRVRDASRFERYFRLSPPETEVPDKAIREIISFAENFGWRLLSHEITNDQAANEIVKRIQDIEAFSDPGVRASAREKLRDHACRAGEMSQIPLVLAFCRLAKVTGPDWYLAALGVVADANEPLVCAEMFAEIRDPIEALSLFQSLQQNGIREDSRKVAALAVSAKLMDYAGGMRSIFSEPELRAGDIIDGWMLVLRETMSRPNVITNYLKTLVERQLDLLPRLLRLALLDDVENPIPFADSDQLLKKCPWLGDISIWTGLADKYFAELLKADKSPSEQDWRTIDSIRRIAGLVD